MDVEQRKEERSSAPELSKGELFHPASGQYLHVESVRDLLFTGIGHCCPVKDFAVIK